jgi:hypothetical protein
MPNKTMPLPNITLATPQLRTILHRKYRNQFVLSFFASLPLLSLEILGN